MAGFSNIGEPGFRISPPRIKSYGTPGFANLQIPGPPSQSAGFYNEPSVGNIGADDSALHLANAQLARIGLGNTGANYGSASDSGYGFTGEDLNNLNRFMVNPQDTGNANLYKSLTERLRNPFQSSGQFGMFSPQQFDQTIANFPQTWGASYGLIPPPTLQNIGIPLPIGSSGFRF